MPSVSDHPYRPWSAGFSLGFGPLWFNPPRPPAPTPVPVEGAKGGFVKVLGDNRPGVDVKVL